MPRRWCISGRWPLRPGRKRWFTLPKWPRKLKELWQRRRKWPQSGRLQWWSKRRLLRLPLRPLNSGRLLWWGGRRPLRTPWLL